MKPKTRSIEWYVGKADASGLMYGPYSREQLLERLRDGKISWIDGVWNPELPRQWRRIIDLPLFRDHLPNLPAVDLIPRGTLEVRAPSEVAEKQEPVFQGEGTVMISEQSQSTRLEPGGKIWYLHFEGSQFGPLSLQEVHVILSSGKLKGALFAWTAGRMGWKPVTEFPEFNGLLKGNAPQADGPEKRDSSRKSFIATVQFSRIRQNGELSSNVHTGISRDISLTGMSVSTSSVPRANGMELRLRVEPNVTDTIPAFQVQAEVVRIFGSEGFAVRFISLPEPVMQAIRRHMEGANGPRPPRDFPVR